MKQTKSPVVKPLAERTPAIRKNRTINQGNFSVHNRHIDMFYQKIFSCDLKNDTVDADCI